VPARRNSASTADPADTTPAAARLRRQYVKLCDLPDFGDPEVRERIRSIVPGHDERAELRRKFWEYAMLTLFFEDVGKLNEKTVALSVGAGHEEVLFWLANKIGRVVATDIYGEGTFMEADETMLTDPGRFAPYPYREDRLDVRRMDARSLEFEDATFDVVFSLSSIEHFGSTRDIRQAAREIGRVLRPAGYAFIVTECFLSRHLTNSRLLQSGVRIATRGRVCEKATLRRRALDVFTPRELESLIVGPSGLQLLQPLDRTTSPETWANVIRWSGPGQYEPATGEPWPHILLQPALSAFSVGVQGAAFTSVALALAKADTRPEEASWRRNSREIAHGER
jgi:SAM-dependent methyltransferase